ncbi:MAG: SIS domain-containing protein, partial [Methanobrevibacter sp.]|nr:SIS domain-containing protein [Methanobrevibacter sp.]
GINAYVVGETISPSIHENDAIVAISGSGSTNSIVTPVKTAKKRGAKILSLTSYPDSELGQISDCVFLVKGRTKIDMEDDYIKRQIKGDYSSLTPLGTAFELTSLIFLDGLVTVLMDTMGKTEGDLKDMHANLE